MGKLLVGHDSNRGGRKYNEDRCNSDLFVSAGGLSMAVAVVCDGVGGEERGERAAQLAVDTLLLALRDSKQTDPVETIIAAVREANSAVHNEALRLGAGERMACTMALAVVVNETTLYVANVGDSRVYLARGGTYQQITRDHTFANVMVWQGKLSAQAANSNPDANRVMRVLGPKPNLQVDMGIYLTTEDYGDANKLGKQGFQLQTGDTILACSDGLIKHANTTKQPLIYDKEILRIVNTSEGNPAAQGVMSIALGRIPVGEAIDNISVAIIQTEDPARVMNQNKIKQAQQERIQREQRRKVLITAIGILIPAAIVLFLVIIGAGYLVVNLSQQANATGTQLAFVTGTAAAFETEVAGYTPTPSLTVPPSPTPTIPPSPVPTLEEGEIAKAYRDEEFLNIVKEGEFMEVPTGESRYVAVNHDQAAIQGTGNLYALESSKLAFNTVTDAKMLMSLLRGTDLFMNTGPYPNGSEVQLDGTSLTLRGQGCWAVEYMQEEPKMRMSCYSGVCTYRLDLVTPFEELKPGFQLVIDDTETVVTDTQRIPQTDSTKYFNLLSRTTEGRKDLARCNVTLPTAVRTPTAVPSQAVTPTPSQASSGPTNTPSTGPTSPPVSTSTNTPVPPTPVTPPTNTPEPPTSTPLPTDTPIPSNTPEPTIAPRDTATTAPPLAPAVSPLGEWGPHI